MRLALIDRVVVFGQHHFAHLFGRHLHHADRRNERIQVIYVAPCQVAFRKAVAANPPVVVESHVAARLAFERLEEDVGHPHLVGRSGQLSGLLLQHRIVAVGLDHLLINRVGRVVGQRNQPERQGPDLLASQSHLGNPHHVQVAARLRDEHAVLHLVDPLVAVSADNQVVFRGFVGQFPVVFRTDVCQRHQHLTTVAQVFVLLERPHGIRKTQPLEDGVVAVRMVVVPVIGHRSDESELLPFTIENDIGFQLRNRRVLADHVGADHRETAITDRFGQRLLPHVELVVAERGHVVPQLVHQLQHGTPSFGLVHIGVACPAVAGIDQDHRRRVPTLGNGRRQLRKILDLGMYIVR